MLSIEDDDDFSPRVSFERRRSSCSLPLTPFLILGGVSSKSIVAYNKLPQGLLKLTVLKLDGSSFEIEVTKSATVLDLKQAVEHVFNHLQQKKPVEISWPHVWGHFCLSYDGQKLVTENDQIKYYGIKDGDQLHFIRHRSVNYNLVKKPSKKQVTLQKLLSSRLENYEENELKDVEKQDQCNDDQDEENKYYTEYHEPKLAHFLTGWFSYSRLSTNSGNSGGICSGVRNLLRLYSDKPYNRRDD